MSSSYATQIDGEPENSAVVDGLFCEQNTELDVHVRMTSVERMWNFVDSGGVVNLYVKFAQDVSGIPYSDSERPSTSKDEPIGASEYAYKVELAGKIVPLEPLQHFKSERSELFKARVTVDASVASTLKEGEPVPFRLEYKDESGNVSVVRSVTSPNKPVYFQPVWNDLKVRDKCLKEKIKKLEEPLVAFEKEAEGVNIVKADAPRRGFISPDTPVQLAKDGFFLHYTRQACKPFLLSQNPFVKIIRELMVAPLTNFTCLSLYYQLYLVEIFHVKFLTKAGHYLCMPVIVLLMATWFAQWRFIGHYTFVDASFFICNGTLVFVLALLLWYIIWGCVSRKYLFGIFMIWPLFVIYILANALFQIIVINSFWIRLSRITVADIMKEWGQNSTHWYDFITLGHFHILWYFHPLLWALMFCAFQALSHIFEDKLPPRVSQTAHWMDMTTFCKNNGCFKSSLILTSQIIFGTLNEFVASPRLLPLLVLRICYTIGYQEGVWKKFRVLVAACLKYGDPAIDYIGCGGAQMPSRFENLDQLKNKYDEIKSGLTKEQIKGLKDPEFLKDPTRFTSLLHYYVLLRHRLTKYEIQVNAYGPFTPKGGGNLEPDNLRMKNDFPDKHDFRIFLKEVRSNFSEMEWQFVNNCKSNHL